MPKILHIVDRLSAAGPTRSLIALVKYQARLGLPYQHQLITLHRDAYPLALIWAKQVGLAVQRQPDAPTLQRALAEADIVQVHFWNTPEFYDLLAGPWPATRLLLWFKIIGNRPPQIITPQMVGLADMCVGTTPLTLALPVLQDKVTAGQVDMIYGMTDFDRLANLKPHPHTTFNVGYIGTVNFSKMHPRFVAMSAAVKIPDVRFIVCGGDSQAVLQRQAAALGATDRFVCHGFVENINPILATLDVFGYPLCEDTYATSEKSLQEAMYAGIPPVVFPYGGVKDLVAHGETGLVVHSEAEYTAAIEYLYHHPAERLRLGLAAQVATRLRFAPDAAARRFDQLYSALLERPKRERHWTGAGLDASPAQRFVDALGDSALHFAQSLAGPDAEAEHAIATASTLLSSGEGGVFHYRNRYPDDPLLRFWAGLILRQQGRHTAAQLEFETAVTLGLDPTRITPYV